MPTAQSIDCCCFRDNYHKYALGEDVINPISGSSRSAGYNHAVTLIDCLDTMWIMGLAQEFSVAVEWIKGNLKAKLDRLSGGVSVDLLHVAVLLECAVNRYLRQPFGLSEACWLRTTCLKNRSCCS